MPKLSKPVQGLIVIVLACLVGAVIYVGSGINEEKGFLNLVEKETTDDSAISPTEEPIDATEEPNAVATAEPSDGTTSTPDNGGDASGESTEPSTAPFGADVNILFQWVMALGLLFGASFAVRKDFTSHRNIMTFLVLVNWFSIFGRMAHNVEGVVNNSENETSIIWIHVVVGGWVMISATYLIIRMWFEDQLPKWFMVKNIKLQMRATLLVWLLIIALGTFMYFDIYG